MTSLLVERVGAGATIQDGGRSGWQRFGISVSGAMDRLSLAVANVLAGNRPDTPAIECAYGGIRLLAEGGPVMVAAAGPGIGLSVGGRAVTPGSSAIAMPGETIEMSPPRGGLYAYLAIAGGVDLAPEMGSLSTHLRSGLGVAPLHEGIRLPVLSGARAPRRLPELPEHGTGPIRVVPGPQDDWFDDAAKDLLFGTEWQFDHRSDRMARFMVGPGLATRPGSMVSDGVLPGSIQVTPSGQAVLLMRDCQTTGGYPKIATVISADLDRLAQIPPGRGFRLVAVSFAQAQAAARERAAMIAALRPVSLTQLDVTRLWNENLISGVWDARAHGDGAGPEGIHAPES